MMASRLKRKGFKTPTKKSPRIEASNLSILEEVRSQRGSSKVQTPPSSSRSTCFKKSPRTSSPSKVSPVGSSKYSPHFSRKKRTKLFQELSLGADAKRKDAVPAEESRSKNTIEKFFSQAQPQKFVPCPVCLDQVPLIAINKHLDNGCLHADPSANDDDDFIQKPSNSTGSVKVNKERKAAEVTVSSPLRKIAEVKSDVKDRRVRLRLKRKMESHPLYRSSSDVAQPAKTLTSESVPSANFTRTDSSPPQEKLVTSEYFSSDENSGHSSSEVIKPPRLKKRLSSPHSSRSLGQRATPSKEAEDIPEGDYSCLERKLSNASECSTVILSSQSQGIPEAQEDVFVMYANSSVSYSSQEMPSDIQYDTSPEYAKLSVSKSGYLKYDNLTPGLTYTSIASDEGDPISDREDTTPDSLTPTAFSSSTDSSSGIGSQSSFSRKPCPAGLTDDPLGTSSQFVNSETVQEGHFMPVGLNEESDLSSTPSHQDLQDFSEPLTSSSRQSTSSLPLSETSASTSSSSSERSNSSQGLSLTIVTPKKTSGSSSPLKRAAEASSPANSPWKYRDPYFLVNFKLILNTVLASEDDRSLFSDQDIDVIDTFRNLSAPSQQLYVRLFQRKHAWLQVGKLDYKRIAVDLTPVVAELQEAGLVQTEQDLTDFDVVLNLCSAPDLKTFAKTLRLAPSVGQTKADLVGALLKHGRQQRSLFAGSMEQVLIKKAKKMIGACLRLSNEPRTIFSRLLLLFSLTTDMDEEDKASGGMSQLQTLLLSNMGRVIYPTYKVMRTVKIFSTKDDLLRYETALHYETDIALAMSTNDFDLAYQLQQKAMSIFEEIQKDSKILSHDLSLPNFIRRFTASWTYTRTAYTGVEILQKLRRYTEAVDALRLLLAQSNYCCDSRGRWWDRLALNLDQHLKKPEQALDAVQEGLADGYVRTGHRLALQLRAQKILKSASGKRFRKRRDDFTFDPVREMPRVTIEGRVLPYQAPGIKNTFVREWTGDRKREGDMAICRVEEVALEHYKGLGYPEGVHGEGSTFTTLVSLLFWDLIFLEGIPDTFCYPYQSGPLDIRSDCFFLNRKEALEQRLCELRQADTEELQDKLETSWMEYHGEQCTGVSWDLFRDVHHAKGLLACLGGEFLSAIAERILRDHRHCRGGMPDLTVWCPVSGKFKLVEVKGPGDRLSHKQILWIDFFLSLGVDAEVCHVTAIGSKRLKLTRALSRQSDVTSSSSQN
ncbi:fanconi-associated nuclease 1-like [Acanthaster planci]|uniref:Fanconi-associated nuclease n=1 Tax=Acanthaster planci TaxID=133434 RepID=A0A8B7ZPE9_ACAPL|nr:fanconi-associated nuclease 1-like [Acanthaster planci]XP_022106780.1 fanconi-associated nuclease 1-like [Acanthaster planci]